jgi:hypothetical protein
MHFVLLFRDPVTTQSGAFIEVRLVGIGEILWDVADPAAPCK